jgi:hypothetical protein
MAVGMRIVVVPAKHGFEPDLARKMSWPPKPYLTRDQIEQAIDLERQLDANLLHNDAA